MCRPSWNTLGVRRGEYSLTTEEHCRGQGQRQRKRHTRLGWIGCYSGPIALSMCRVTGKFGLNSTLSLRLRYTVYLIQPFHLSWLGPLYSASKDWSWSSSDSSVAQAFFRKSMGAEPLFRDSWNFKNKMGKKAFVLGIFHGFGLTKQVLWLKQKRVTGPLGEGLSLLQASPSSWLAYNSWTLVQDRLPSFANFPKHCMFQSHLHSPRKLIG